VRWAVTSGLLLALAGAARAEVDPGACDGIDVDGGGKKKALAAEHYRRGQELYAQGEYEASIP